MEKSTADRTVGIIGTGNFARALAKRLYYAGYDIVIGSRRPSERNVMAIGECLCDITLTSVDNCIKQAKVIFLAVHAENYRDCLNRHIDKLENRILVDVSNRERPSKTESNAEYLRNLAPKSSVVKAFNVISAYAMEDETVGSSKQVFLASDDIVSREKISSLARDMGFQPVDMGCLRSSRKIESFPLRLFPRWCAPIGFTIGVFNIWVLYIIFIYFVEKTAYRWDQIFVKVLNKPLCMTAITVLSTTYLAGSLAGVVQLYYGTKHIRFPSWLDRWMKSRKQLGIIAFTLTCVHVLMSVLIMSPTYLKSWYQPTEIMIPVNMTTDLVQPMRTWMVWKGEAACLTGIIAFINLCFIAVSTVPAVADSLNWREWRLVQSKMGCVALFMSIAHVTIMGAPGWSKGGPVKTLRSITFLSLVLPFITIVLRILLSFPIINRKLKRIRKGWERKPNKCVSSCSGEPVASPGYLAVGIDNYEQCTCARESITVTLLDESTRKDTVL